MKMSKVAPVWNSNCCLTSPVRPSQMMAVLSTEPDSSRSPFLFHFREKMGPLWFVSVFLNSPAFSPHALSHPPAASKNFSLCPS